MTVTAASHSFPYLIIPAFFKTYLNILMGLTIPVILIACPIWLMLLSIFQGFTIRSHIYIITLWNVYSNVWAIFYLVTCFLVIFMLLTHTRKEAWENGIRKESKSCICLLTNRHKRDWFKNFKLSFKWWLWNLAMC